MRRAVIALCSVWLGTAVGSSGQQQPPVFRGGVELVTLDVTVVDRDGTPVKGLKPEDFVVTLDGQTRAVRALDFLEYGASAGSDTVPTRQTTNDQRATAPQKRGGRVFLIVFDDLSCKPMQAKALTVAAERMLGTLDLDDFVGIVTTSGLGPVVQPTRDRAAVLAALKNKTFIGRYDDNPSPRYFIAENEALEIFSGQPPSTLYHVIERECGIPNYRPGGRGGKGDDGICPMLVEADGRHLGELTVHRTASQMAAYRAAIGALGAAPSPRIIIALSSGVATSVTFDLKEQTDSISRAAAEAGVQFYALTEVGDEFDMSATVGGARRQENAYLMSGVQTVATAAGGEAFLVVGTADRFFKRIETETSGFYRLGVEAPVPIDKGRFLKAKVSVRRPGVLVRTNPAALMATVAPEAVPLGDRLQKALTQGGTSFGVPIALATALRRDPAGAHLQLGVNVQVPAAVSGPLVAMFAVVDERGRIVQQGRIQVPPSTPPQDYQLALPVLLAPGRYRLRFAVADANGNVGSLEHQVNASLPHLETCAVSDLFTTWAEADGVPHFLALETVPASATTLRASLELYPDDPASSDLTVRLALVPAGETDPLVERDLTPTGIGTTRTVASLLPADQLKPGVYTIRATVLRSGTVVGTVSTLIRKKGPPG